MRKIGAIAALVAFACIMGMGFAQYGGYGYGYGTTVATTVATTTIAQNHTSTTTVNNTGPVARIAPPLLYANTAYSANINATAGGNVSTTLIGSTIKAVIAPGTYARLANGTKLSSYNFSIILFHVTNVTSPSNKSMSAFGAFAYAINGKVSPSITLVNSTGSAMPVTTYYTLITSPTSPPLNITSYAWLGGNYSVENGTMFYRGGAYSGQDTWTRINNFTEVNTQFVNPIVWVQDIVPQAQPATTTAAPTTTIIATTTSQQAPAAPSNYTGAAVGIVIVIVIVVAAAAMLMRKKR